MEERAFAGELEPVFLQDNPVESEDFEEIEAMRIELQCDYENKLMIIKETIIQEIIK